MSAGTHYSMAFNIKEMKAYCVEAANALNAFQQDCGADIVFMYSGLSGVSTATALAHYLFNEHGIIPHMIYVRKVGENNHNDSTIEHSDNDVGNFIALFFVDDLIESCDTINRTVEFGLDADFLEDFDVSEVDKANVGKILIDELSNYSFSKPEHILKKVS